MRKNEESQFIVINIRRRVWFKRVVLFDQAFLPSEMVTRRRVGVEGRWGEVGKFGSTIMVSFLSSTLVSTLACRERYISLADHRSFSTYVVRLDPTRLATSNSISTKALPCETRFRQRS